MVRTADKVGNNMLVVRRITTMSFHYYPHMYLFVCLFGLSKETSTSNHRIVKFSTK